MQEDIDIEVWVKNAIWCPNPDSDREMQLDFRLILDGENLLVAVSKNRILGALDKGLSRQLYHLHRAGADFDVTVQDSIPEEKMFLVYIYLSGDEIEDLSGKIKESKKQQRDLRNDLKARTKAEIDRKAKIRQAKRQRRIELLIRFGRAIKSIGPFTYRALSVAKSSVCRWWRSLVKWTNR